MQVINKHLILAANRLQVTEKSAYMGVGLNGPRFQHYVIPPVSLLFEDQSNALSNKAFVPVWNMTLHIRPSMAVTLSVRVKRPFSVHVHCRLSVSGCCCFFFCAYYYDTTCGTKTQVKWRIFIQLLYQLLLIRSELSFFYLSERNAAILFFPTHFPFLILSHSPFPLLNFSLLTSSLNTAAKIWDTKREWDRKVKEKSYK